MLGDPRRQEAVRKALVTTGGRPQGQRSTDHQVGAGGQDVGGAPRP